MVSIFNSSKHPMLYWKQTPSQDPAHARLRKSGHCALPELFSKQPLPFGVLCLIAVLPQRCQWLQLKELCIPFHVFSGEVEEDTSGAPQAGREEGSREVKSGLASALRTDALIHHQVLPSAGPCGRQSSVIIGVVHGPQLHLKLVLKEKCWWWESYILVLICLVHSPLLWVENAI